MAEFSLQDRLLLILIIGIGVLCILVLSFTASAIVLRLKNNRKAARWAKLEETWDTDVIEVLYEGRAPETLWRNVERPVEFYFVNYLVRYMRRLAGDECARIRELAAPYLPRVAEHLKRRGPERRARAVQTLGELGLPQYSPQILAALDDPSPLVAMTAARALSRKEHPEFADSVLTHLHRFTNWRPSFLAAMLAAIGPPAAPALRQTFGDEESSAGVRAIAAQALGQLNDLTSADIALRVLQSAADRELIAASLRLLERVGRPEHLAAVRLLLDADDPVVRGAAAGALGRLGGGEDITRLRVIACEDTSHWVAIKAARALREIGGVRDLRELAASAHGRAALALQVLAETGT